jgi:hypothetical protein
MYRTTRMLVPSVTVVMRLVVDLELHLVRLAVAQVPALVAEAQV